MQEINYKDYVACFDIMKGFQWVLSFFFISVGRVPFSQDANYQEISIASEDQDMVFYSQKIKVVLCYARKMIFNRKPHHTTPHIFLIAFFETV